ncbi:MAG: hypothetical protein RAP70_00565 [Candidatus Celaenobacter antarcticus]|nr:hypothetical protein [Candidatus Celaenobacter antarcticus]MDP8313554.1 hypothetical protein [Candidatus Celaenobacter antarcticus]
MGKIHYPFAAIVGQEELLLGIILNSSVPKLGGLLIKGVKGSGKSTAVYLSQVVPYTTDSWHEARFSVQR